MDSGFPFKRLFGLGLINRRARVYLCHDDQNLYIAYKQNAAIDRRGHAQPFKMEKKDKDEPVWEDDSLEVIFTSPKSSKFLHLGFSASGARYDALWSAVAKYKGEEKKEWDGNWIGEVKIEKDTLIIELAVPWQMLQEAGLEKDNLEVNFLHQGKLGNRHYYVRRDFERNARKICFFKRSETPLKPYTVRLHFIELDDVKTGQRVFDVILQGKVVLKNLDIIKAAGGKSTALVKEFRSILADKTISLELIHKAKDIRAQTAPIISGIEVVAEKQEKSP